MKIFIVIVILLLSSAASFAQRVPSSCTAPDSVLNLCREDAAKLALDRQIEMDSSYAKRTEIRQSLQDTFLRALVAVHNSGLKAANAIFGKVYIYDPIEEIEGTIYIHDNMGRPVREFNVDLDTSIRWERNLYFHKFPTGNDSMDSLIQAYGITCDTSTALYHPTILKTGEFYNVVVIVKLWNDITHSDPEAKEMIDWEDGNHITQSISDSSMTLTFEYAWGDCPSGCIWHHDWIFKVFNDCSVQFVSDFGTDVGLDWSVKGKQLDNSTLTLYPNPSTNILTIETQSLTTLEILTLDGKRIRTISCNDDKTEIPVAALSKGTYIIRLTSRDGVVQSGKFVKE
ncbi:MAG TPA: T9SS type A sorting domain-containing protein [Candidatus Kapabacteria bacterium]|nr:T9SS type A sorting domain-containing protein [Candidatus Kapabacteria bacterium]